MPDGAYLQPLMDEDKEGVAPEGNYSIIAWNNSSHFQPTRVHRAGEAVKEHFLHVLDCAKNFNELLEVLIETGKDVCNMKQELELRHCLRAWQTQTANCTKFFAEVLMDKMTEVPAVKVRESETSEQLEGVKNKVKNLKDLSAYEEGGTGSGENRKDAHEEPGSGAAVGEVQIKTQTTTTSYEDFLRENAAREARNREKDLGIFGLASEDMFNDQGEKLPSFVPPSEVQPQQTTPTKKRGKKEPYKCDLCEFSAVRHENFVAHQFSVHQIGGIICEECGERFSRKTSKEYHRRTQHNVTGGTVYRCSVCPYTNPNLDRFQGHQYEKHGIGEGVHCERCHRVFSSKAGWAKHQRICKASAAKQATVNREEEREKYLCAQCGARYSSRQAFRSHIQRCGQEAPGSRETQTKTSEANQDQVSEPSGSQTVNPKPGPSRKTGRGNVRTTPRVNKGQPKEGKKECDICNKKFPTKAAVYQHIREEHSEQPGEEPPTKKRREDENESDDDEDRESVSSCASIGSLLRRSQRKKNKNQNQGGDTSEEGMSVEEISSADEGLTAESGDTGVGNISLESIVSVSDPRLKLLSPEKREEVLEVIAKKRTPKKRTPKKNMIKLTANFFSSSSDNENLTSAELDEKIREYRAADAERSGKKKTTEDFQEIDEDISFNKLSIASSAIQLAQLKGGTEGEKLQKVRRQLVQHGFGENELVHVLERAIERTKDSKEKAQLELKVARLRADINRQHVVSQERLVRPSTPRTPDQFNVHRLFDAIETSPGTSPTKVQSAASSSPEQFSIDKYFDAVATSPDGTPTKNEVTLSQGLPLWEAKMLRAQERGEAYASKFKSDSSVAESELSVVDLATSESSGKEEALDLRTSPQKSSCAPPPAPSADLKETSSETPKQAEPKDKKEVEKGTDQPKDQEERAAEAVIAILNRAGPDSPDRRKQDAAEALSVLPSLSDSSRSMAHELLQGSLRVDAGLPAMDPSMSCAPKKEEPQTPTQEESMKSAGQKSGAEVKEGEGAKNQESSSATETERASAKEEVEQKAGTSTSAKKLESSSATETEGASAKEHQVEKASTSDALSSARQVLIDDPEHEREVQSLFADTLAQIDALNRESESCLTFSQGVDRQVTDLELDTDEDTEDASFSAEPHDCPCGITFNSALLWDQHKGSCQTFLRGYQSSSSEAFSRVGLTDTDVPSSDALSKISEEASALDDTFPSVHLVADEDRDKYMCSCRARFQTPEELEEHKIDCDGEFIQECPCGHMMHSVEDRSAHEKDCNEWK